ncbi:MAG: NBR1-Ig-like domain-containing protein [Chloroflexota bacterium]
MLRRMFLGTLILVGLLTSQVVPPARADAYCDSAQFISDLTVPDGTAFAPGTPFTKSWRLLNNGTCTWTTAYTFIWVGGDSLGAPLSVNIPVEVPPGQMLDMSVNMTAPMAAGHYKGYWKISNASGVQFGVGESVGDAFWVDINVIETSAIVYDFVANAPYAVWKSERGILPYPGASGDSRGYSYQLNNPHLEDDSYDSSPGLLFVPHNKYNGYIQATYPEIQIQAGDKLQTLVNCEFGSTNCYVTFRIDYVTPAGNQKELWSFREAYEGRFYRADIDLSRLAGQRVRFVLMVLATGYPSGDRAIWGSPRIVRTGTVESPPFTFTPLPPFTPTATPFGQPLPTIGAPVCNKASFVADITVPDGTFFSPGAAFTKTWRVKNSGSCGWTTAYKFLFYGGDQMSAPTSINMPRAVSPGETVDLTVNMAAPTSAGRYRGDWVLSTAGGALFGVGANASNPIWVEVNVAGDIPAGSGYDFVANACSAQWKSGAGILPCPGVEGDRKGFMVASNSTHLEDGTMGPAPSLLVSPENKYNGYIQGIYPAFTVQPGDRFRAVIGCEYGYSCYVTFQLDYLTATGSLKNFWTFREKNEGRNYTADLNLSPLAGQSVRFVLTILATGSSTGDRARWTAPYIVRAEGPPVTPTVTPTATPSPTFTPTPTATATTTPIPTPTAFTGDWLGYTNSYYGFTLMYPPRLEDLPSQDPNYARIDLPFRGGTNLAEKYLEIIVAENLSVCQSPLASQSILETSETVTINGIPFLKQTGGDAGAGNFYDWVAYSTLKDNVCVSLDFVLHSLNPGNFATPPPVFDEAAESAVFGAIVSTFAWLPPTPTPTPTATAAASLAPVQSVEVQIVESQPVGANAVVRGVLPDTGCTTISSISQLQDGSTFRLTLSTATDPFAVCDPIPTPFERVVALDVGSLLPARYTVNANGVEQAFELVTRDVTRFNQTVVEALNAKNYDALKVLMDQSFIFAFWQSQGFSSTPDEAVVQLQNYIGANTVLAADPNKDLTVLLGGFDPYAIMGLDPSKSQALFVSGWGLDGAGEALLYATHLPDGSLYWYGVLIAPSKFVTP